MIMQLIVKMLITTFVVLTISGCSHKILYVPSECNIPDYSEVVLDLTDRNTTLGESKRCTINYTKQKEANEKMVKAIKLCQ
jgi:hypothetical protein